MEDVLYLSKESVTPRDVIEIAKQFGYTCRDTGETCDNVWASRYVRVIPARGAYWDFVDYQATPDFQCLGAKDLQEIKQFSPGTVLIVTHPYDTRLALAKFIRRLIERRGGGVVRDGNFDHIDDLSNLGPA